MIGVVAATLICGPGLVHARPTGAPRNYGLLGNAIASLVDSLNGHPSSTPQVKGGDAGAKSSVQPHTDGQETTPSNVQRNYGILGNAIAALIEGVGSQPGPGMGMKGGSGSWAPRGRLSHLGARSKDGSHGPLGKLMAHLANHAFGNGTMIDSSESVDFSTEAASGNCTASKNPSVGVKRLQGLRELVRLLWSNFMPDPTFDAAVQQLKKLDAQLGVDVDPEAFVTPQQLELLLARVADCKGQFCLQPSLHTASSVNK